MRPRTARIPAEERERRIIQTATQVFAGSNFRVAGTAEIARQAGISEPTIYKYFASKKALFLSVLTTICERILTSWRSISSSSGVPAISLLERIGRSYFDKLQTHPEALQIQLQALSESADDEIAAQLRENHASYVAVLEAMIRRAQEEGSVGADVDAELGAWLLNVTGFAMTFAALLGVERGLERRLGAAMIQASLDWLTTDHAKESS